MATRKELRGDRLTATPISVTIINNSLGSMVLEVLDVQEESKWDEEYLDSIEGKTEFVELAIKLAQMSVDRVARAFRYAVKVDFQEHHKIAQLVKERFPVDEIYIMYENYYETLGCLEFLLKDYLTKKYKDQLEFSVDINMGVPEQLITNGLNVINWE